MFVYGKPNAYHLFSWNTLIHEINSVLINFYFSLIMQFKIGHLMLVPYHNTFGDK